MSMQQYCLRWNNHQPNFISVFSSLLNNESLVDVTLSAEGRHLQAHKLVLSACSSYFQSLFTINPCQHPIVILKDVNFVDLKVMIDFMYYGEVNVSQEQLPHILKTAELLKIKGLAEIPVDASVQAKQQQATTTTIGNSTTDRGGQTELLSTTGDNGTATVSSWSTSQDTSGLINLRQSISPGLGGSSGSVSCPLSPSSRRKRLRKSSTSTENRPTSLTQTNTTLDPSDLTHTTSHPSPLHLHLPHHTLPILHPLHHHHSTHHQITSIVNNEASHSTVISATTMSPMAATTTGGAAGGGSSSTTSSATTVSSIKPDPGGQESSGGIAAYGSGNNGDKYEQLQVQQQPVGLLHRVGSHDSGNGGGDSSHSHSPHQITLQIPSQDMNQSSHTIETPSIEIPGSSSTSSQPDRIQIVSTPPTTSNQSPPVLLHITPTVPSRLVATSPPPSSNVASMATMGTKRYRFLKRQSRVKRELDTSSSDPIHPHLYHQHSSEHYERYGDNLTVPHRVERQVSDPLPVSGPVSPPPHGGRMLTVPGSGGILVKQHSHPLLPSQQSQPYHLISSPPISSHTSSSSHSTQTTSTSTETDSVNTRPVIFIDSLTTPHSAATAHHESAPHALALGATTTLRVRTDELKRSASSPAQTSAARSSHCPVVRSGPALGCNYCWNTVDTHGRILRRKTKYHCPECQTNLCIVPCFQEYHERHSAGTAEALTLTQSVLRVFPKTSSM